MTEIPEDADRFSKEDGYSKLTRGTVPHGKVFGLQPPVIGALIDPKGEGFDPDEYPLLSEAFRSDDERSDEEKERAEEALEDADVDADAIVAELEGDLEVDTDD